MAKFKTRDGITEPMREAAAKHNIKLISSLAQLRELTKCGELIIALSGKITAPALKECGYLDARAATTFTAPALKECGYLEAKAATTFTAPALKECGYLDASAAIKKQIASNNAVNRQGRN